MKLYKREGYSYVSGQMTHKGHEDVAATLDDIKAYLAEQGMVAVYKTDVEHVAVCYKALTEVPRYKRMAESLIKAAGEG